MVIILLLVVQLSHSLFVCSSCLFYYSGYLPIVRILCNVIIYVLFVCHYCFLICITKYEFKICTFNVNGLGEYKKRRQIFEWLKHGKYEYVFYKNSIARKFLMISGHRNGVIKHFLVAIVQIAQV